MCSPTRASPGRRVDWAARTLAMAIDIVRKPDGQRGFQVQLKRWVLHHRDVYREVTTTPATRAACLISPRGPRGGRPFGASAIGCVPDVGGRDAVALPVGSDKAAVVGKAPAGGHASDGGRVGRRRGA